MASGSGVHRCKDGVWLTNGEADGLPADAAFKVFEDTRGRIWAGTGRGLSLYDPTADRDAPRAILAESNAAEAPPDGNVNIAFCGVDRWKYTLPDRLLFSYRLDGGRGPSSARRQRAAAPAGARPAPLRGPGDGSQRQRRPRPNRSPSACRSPGTGIRAS